MEKAAHIDRRRPLPRLARRSLHKRLRSRQAQSKTDNAQSRVAYFPDVFAEHNDPAIGEALIALLEQAGVRVEVPKLRACGILAMCYGRTDAALRTIRANLEPLREYARAGMDILVTEPTALLCLRREYADFVGEAAREVAEHCHDAVEYLAALHREGRLDVSFDHLPLTLAWHTPCHARALDLTGAPELLAAVPGLSVVPIEEGCCGIAGSAGLRRSKYDLSMQIGDGLFRRVREACFDGAATSCSTCRMQIEHGAGTPVYHPLHLLARSAFGTPLPGPTLL
jgi:Fe-S oxidoreductase